MEPGAIAQLWPDRPKHFDDALEGVRKAEPVPVDSLEIAELNKKTRAPYRYAVMFSGYLMAPETARYSFSAKADDLARIYVDGELVVQYDEDIDSDLYPTHGSAVLAKGAHRLEVLFLQQGGRPELYLYFRKDGERYRDLGVHLMRACDASAAQIAASGDGVSL